MFSLQSQLLIKTSTRFWDLENNAMPLVEAYQQSSIIANSTLFSTFLYPLLYILLQIISFLDPFITKFVVISIAC